VTSGVWRAALVAVLLAIAQRPAVAQTQVARDQIPLGLEFCLIAAEDPERAAEFARARDLVDTEPAAEVMAFGREGAPAFMGVRVHRQENGDFATECGFEAIAVGEITRAEIEALGTQFSLEIVSTDGEGRYGLARRSSHLAIWGFASPTDAIPCLADGLTIAPEVLREHPQIVDEIAAVCNKPGFRMLIWSAHSTTQIPQ